MRKPLCLGKRNPNCTAPYHGTQSAYTRVRCRCDHAREDYRINRKRRREGRYQSALVDITGSTRRVRAMHADGWPYTHIAAKLGHSWTWQRVQETAEQVRPLIYRNRATQIANLSHQLAGTPGPSARARNNATRKGWHNIIAWDNIDNPAEQPAVPMSTAGETLAERAVRHAQRLEDFRNLRDAGVGRKRIQDQLHINSRVYVKLLAQIQDTATDEGQAAA